MARKPSFATASGEEISASKEFYRGVPGYGSAAYWWGFHIPFSYADVDDILNPTFILATAVTALTAVLPGTFIHTCIF